MDISIVSLIATLIVAATPILLAATGELIVEKAGVLNLGVEGMMIIGAICGFIAAVNTDSPLMGFVFAALAGAALSFLFAVLTQVLLANQVASGLALTLFGLGLAALLGHSYSGIKPPSSPKIEWFGLADIPVVGPILFNHDLMVYFSILLVITVWVFLKFTRAGLILRAVGENHDAARCGLDRAGNRCFRQLEAMAVDSGCLFVRRGHDFTAEFAGKWRRYSSFLSFYGTIPCYDFGSGYYVC